MSRSDDVASHRVPHNHAQFSYKPNPSKLLQSGPIKPKERMQVHYTSLVPSNHQSDGPCDHKNLQPHEWVELSQLRPSRYQESECKHTRASWGCDAHWMLC